MKHFLFAFMRCASSNFSYQYTAAKVRSQPLAVGGAFTVGKDMQPCDYVLQIIIEDPTKKGSRQYAVQWVDFQIAN